jgi:hypothetical protein
MVYRPTLYDLKTSTSVALGDCKDQCLLPAATQRYVTQQPTDKRRQDADNSEKERISKLVF